MDDLSGTPIRERVSNDGLFIVVRRIFKKKPLEWRAAFELVRRGSYKVVDRKRHLLWEWVAIDKI